MYSHTSNRVIAAQHTSGGLSLRALNLFLGLLPGSGNALLLRYGAGSG